MAVGEARRAGGGTAARGLRQERDLRRTCEPPVQIGFGSLAPSTLGPMTAGEGPGLGGI